MHLKYLHYFGNESNESLLEAYGIVSSGQQIDQLRPKQCPNCSEPNKPDSKFCAKCRMVLTYDAYNETLEKQQAKETEISEWKKQHLQDINNVLSHLKAMQIVQDETQKELAELKKYRLNHMKMAFSP
jgi:predicted amidophosphoribosyltransferase